MLAEIGAIRMAELYRKIADIERRQGPLASRRGDPPQYTPNRRARTVAGAAFRHGALSSIISSMEKEAMDVYDHQPEAL
jgi:hypothetical protein